jgi:hypothetical protein
MVYVDRLPFIEDFIDDALKDQMRTETQGDLTKARN